jgi:hypothetical protein
MSVTLDIPDQLAELMRALAHERGMSIEELGRQVLATGLATLAGGVTADIVDIESARETRLAPGTQISMRSPIVTTSPVRLRPITIEPAAEAPGDAH